MPTKRAPEQSLPFLVLWTKPASYLQIIHHGKSINENRFDLYKKGKKGYIWNWNEWGNIFRNWPEWHQPSSSFLWLQLNLKNGWKSTYTTMGWNPTWSSILNFMFMLLPFHEILMKHSYYNNLKIKAVVGKQECYLKNNVIPLDFEVVRRQKKFFGVE